MCLTKLVKRGRQSWCKTQWLFMPEKIVLH
jgi:hypothetical protein